MELKPALHAGGGASTYAASLQVKLGWQKEMKPLLIAIATIGLLSFAKGLQPVDVKVTFEESFYGFNVSLSGVEWLRSGPIGIRDAGQWWASNNKEKYLMKVVEHFEQKGEDIFGAFDITE